MKKPPKNILRPSNLNGLVDETQQIDPQDLVNIDKRVGKEIKALRKARDATLTDLSDATGLSRGYLSQIERGLSVPSVKALHQISRALGVTISWFFMSQTTDGADLQDVVVRANNRRSLRFSSGITDELLSPNLERQIELLRCTFAPGSESGSEPYTHRGEESGVVLSGELQLWLEDRHLVLKVGDSFAFSSDLPHRYANKSDVDTIVIWAVTPPTY
jgi:transcriptional regulator with XRE-family HTH domain